MEETTNKGVAIYIEKSNVDIPVELEIKGDVNHIKVSIEVNGECSHITLNKGGDAVVDKSIATKYDAEVLAGDDRYETNREVINEFYGGSETLYFANGETLVDALTTSTIAKYDGLVLVGRKSDNKILNRKNTIQVGGMNFDVDFEK